MGKIKVRDLRESLKFKNFHIRAQDRIWLERVERALQPCPFCGEEAEIYTKYLRMHDGFCYKPVWVAGCHSCRIYQGAHHIEDMLSLWNHRASFPDPDLEPFEVVNIKVGREIEPVCMRMCPFCGKSPKLEKTEKYRDPYCMEAVPYWRISCPECEIEQEASTWEMTEKCWNRRMDPNDYPPWNAGRVRLPDDWLYNWPDMELMHREDVESFQKWIKENRHGLGNP